MIDLHMHSRESDGSIMPRALAEACAKAGLTAAALTDHDTLGGCRTFLAGCAEAGLKGLAAVELSAAYNPGTMHILGYIPEQSIEALQLELARIQGSRDQRNQLIIESLGVLGYPVTHEEIAAQAGSGMTGRPHIAAVMLARGYVKSPQEAFTRFLGKGCPAYRERYRLSPSACIATIQRYGGVAVLAHPFTLGVSVDRLAKVLDTLVADGLGGIEVHYPEHNDDRMRLYRRLANERSLIQTGGSDFHGELNPSIQLGRGFGNVHVPDEVFDQLQERLARPDANTGCDCCGGSTT
jgi:3',5'-nucleoside bisphosphate phosphatase